MKLLKVRYALLFMTLVSVATAEKKQPAMNRRGT